MTSLGQSVNNLLPFPGFAEGWVIQEKIETFTEKDLYKYINGEAELYYPYGFKALATAKYVRSDNPDGGIIADIYELGSPLEAFGIYSRYRDPDEESVNIGTEGFVNESQLLFAKNRFFVRLSPSGTVTMEKAVFLAFAQSVAKKIPDSKPPKVLDILNVPGITPRTQTYITQGVLGYAFFKKGLTADANLDGNIARAFIILEESEESASRAFDEYKNYLGKSKAEFSVKKEGNSSMIIARDPLYKGTALMHSGSYLVGMAKLSDPEKAIPLIKQIESRAKTM